MREQTCCFTGHRNLPDLEIPTIKKRLLEEIENLIQQDVTCFLAGGAWGFDTLAAQSVLNLTESYPHVQLHLILPCLNSNNTTAFNEIYKKAHVVQLLSEHYYNGCMHVRNRYLVDHSRYCICYRNKALGGTAYTVKYAKQKGLTVIDLKPQQLSLFDISP